MRERENIDYKLMIKFCTHDRFMVRSKTFWTAHCRSYSCGCQNGHQFVHRFYMRIEYIPIQFVQTEGEVFWCLYIVRIV